MQTASHMLYLSHKAGMDLGKRGDVGMKDKKKRPVIFSVLFSAVIAVGAWIAWGNTALTTQEIKVTSSKLPQSFEGLRIAQVSDLHNGEFGQDNGTLIETLKGCRPDLIVLTGDLIDSYHTDLARSIAVAKKAAEIAPTYFVPGNHEARISTYQELIAGLTDSGVVVLQNTAAVLERDGAHITLLGVCDPSFQTDYLSGDEGAVMDAALSEGMKRADGYTVLLSHRPELFAHYVSHQVDLVFSGHAHGGQVRLPFVGGVVAPGQGLFPQYDAGLYAENTTTMIVSRGLGNSLFPFRVNNRPEIVVVELSK